MEKIKRERFVNLKKRPERHGMSKYKIYFVWLEMRRRCDNPNHKWYDNYGGRGIYVCDRWNNSFVSFYEDMGSTYSDGLDLDRINNNGPYSKENCRWATRNINNTNKRTKGKYLKGTKPNGKGTDFQARIKVFDKEYYIGNFKTMEQAHNAYLKVHKEWYGF